MRPIPPHNQRTAVVGVDAFLVTVRPLIVLTISIAPFPAPYYLYTYAPNCVGVGHGIQFVCARAIVRHSESDATAGLWLTRFGFYRKLPEDLDLIDSSMIDDHREVNRRVGPSSLLLESQGTHCGRL